jgi:hypothetical protein
MHVVPCKREIKVTGQVQNSGFTQIPVSSVTDLGFYEFGTSEMRDSFDTRGGKCPVLVDLAKIKKSTSAFTSDVSTIVVGGSATGGANTTNSTLSATGNTTSDGTTNANTTSDGTTNANTTNTTNNTKYPKSISTDGYTNSVRFGILGTHTCTTQQTPKTPTKHVKATAYKTETASTRNNKPFIEQKDDSRFITETLAQFKPIGEKEVKIECNSMVRSGFSLCNKYDYNTVFLID